MNTSLIALAESLVGWLADFYLLATVLLGLSFLGLRWVRQPVHRLSVAWIVMIELGVLAVVVRDAGLAADFAGARRAKSGSLVAARNRVTAEPGISGRVGRAQR